MIWNKISKLMRKLLIIPLLLVSCMLRVDTVPVVQIPVVDIVARTKKSIFVVFSYKYNEKKLRNAGSGTGFVIDKNRKWIVTAYHVIKDADVVKVSQYGKLYSCKIITVFPQSDLALIKVNKSELNYSLNRSCSRSLICFCSRGERFNSFHCTCN